MKNQPRRPRIEYVGVSPSSKASKAEPPKKGFVARHPLLSGLVVAAGIGLGALALSGNKEKSRPEKEIPANVENRDAIRKKIKEKRMRHQVEKIRKTLEVQKKLIRGGWYAEQEESVRRGLREAELEFMVEIEGKSKGELVDLLLAQNRVIGQLRAENDTDTLAHEESKRKVVQERLDEVEIEERGLLEKTLDELESLLAVLDDIIMDEGNYFVGFEEYMEAMEGRVLVVKAIEEKKIWESVFFPSNVYL